MKWDPEKGIEIVTFEGDLVRVKEGATGLAHPETEAVVFSDPAGEIDYHISNIDNRDIDFPDHVQADLVITDIEHAVSSEHRIRIKRHLREASTVTWEHIGDNRSTWRKIGAAALATGALIGVLTLCKFRKKRNNEQPKP